MASGHLDPRHIHGATNLRSELLRDGEDLLGTDGLADHGIEEAGHQL